MTYKDPAAITEGGDEAKMCWELAIAWELGVRASGVSANEIRTSLTSGVAQRDEVELIKGEKQRDSS